MQMLQSQMATQAAFGRMEGTNGNSGPVLTFDEEEEVVEDDEQGGEEEEEFDDDELCEDEDGDEDDSILDDDDDDDDDDLDGNPGDSHFSVSAAFEQPVPDEFDIFSQT